MKRLRREREKPVPIPSVTSGPSEFECPLDYRLGYNYTRQEIIDVITPHRELLCFFARVAGKPRCVLGMDFDRYDAARQRVPVYVLTSAMVNLLSAAEGREFKRAYRDSRCGRDVLVTFTGPWGRGWFVLQWQLSPERARDLDGVTWSEP
jgi:hypothetical protein